ncbi:hypothetical protein COBT_002566, partial [Conglomerata obtusa]
MVLFKCTANIIGTRATRSISNTGTNVINTENNVTAVNRHCVYNLTNPERESIANRATEILNADISRVLDTLNLTEQDQFHNANFTECYQNNANIKAGNEYLKKNCPKR